MNQPWHFIGFGALFLAFGGFLTWMSFAYDHTGYVGLAGWLIGGVAGLVLFVGVTALAVEIGVRASKR